MYKNIYVGMQMGGIIPKHACHCERQSPKQSAIKIAALFLGCLMLNGWLHK